MPFQTLFIISLAPMHAFSIIIFHWRRYNRE